MSFNAPKLLSGRVPITPYNKLPSSRYEFLGLSEAEPSLGVPTANGSLFTSTTTGVRSWSNVVNIGSNVVTFYEKYAFPNATGTVGQVLSSDGAGNLVFTSMSDSTSIVNGTSNVSIPVANGNVNVSVNGNANVLVVTGTGANLTGNLSLTGNITNVNSVSANSVSANFLVSTSGCVTIAQAVIAVSGNNAGIFASLIDDVNIGLEANVVMGSPTGNVTSRGTFNAPNVVTTGTTSTQNLTVGDLYSSRSPVAVTTDTIVDSFGVNEYRSAKYTIRASNDLGYQALEVLLIHNNINSIITVYGSLSTTGSDIVTLETVINTGLVQLRATGLASNTVLNLLGTYVPD
jgi:hypothetical protein